MQPGQAPSPHQNPYGFILDNKKPKKKNLLAGGSLKKRIMIVTGGGLILMIAVILFASLLGGGGNLDSMIGLAQEQNELIRVADIGVIKGRGSTARNLAQTATGSLNTTQAQTLEYLKKQGTKLDIKALSLKKNSTTDQQLNAAALNNTFDDAFIKIMQEELKTYQTNVKKAYDSTSSKTQKSILADSYNGVNVLLSAQSN